MIQSIQKPLSLLIGFAALSLAGVPSVAAINNDSVAAPAFTDSLDTTLRPCTQLRCEIGGGFDRASTPSSDSGAGGGWANQQETIRLSGAQPGGGSGAGGGWANQQETIRLSAAQPTGESGAGGGWIQ